MSTTTSFGPDFYKDLVLGMFKAIDDAQRQAIVMIWDIVITFLKLNWLDVSLFLFGLLVLGFLLFIFTGRWGFLASISYHYLYGGFILLLGFTFGPEIFANEFVDLILLGVYIVCFILVGIGIRKTGIRR